MLDLDVYMVLVLLCDKFNAGHANYRTYSHGATVTCCLYMYMPPKAKHRVELGAFTCGWLIHDNTSTAALPVMLYEPGTNQ